MSNFFIYRFFKNWLCFFKFHVFGLASDVLYLTNLALFSCRENAQNAQKFSYLFVIKELTPILPILKLALFFIFY